MVADLLLSASKPYSNTGMQKLSTIDKVRGVKITLTEEKYFYLLIWRLHLKFGPDKNTKPKKVSLFCQSIT